MRRAFCFCADEDTPASGAQQRTTGPHRFAGVAVARPGEDQDRTATPFAPTGKCPVNFFSFLGFFVVFVRSHLLLGHATNFLSYFFKFFFFFYRRVLKNIHTAVRLGFIISGTTRIFSEGVSA